MRLGERDQVFHVLNEIGEAFSLGDAVDLVERCLIVAKEESARVDGTNGLAIPRTDTSMSANPARPAHSAPTV